MEQKQTAVGFIENAIDKYIAYVEGSHKAEPFTITQLSEAVHHAKEMEKQQRKIEFPSDKEIKEYTNSIRYYGHCTSEYREGIEDGVKWVRDKIIGGNK